MKRRQMPFALASVRADVGAACGLQPCPAHAHPCFEMWRPAGRKENFSSRRETADAFGISLRWERKRETDLETAREEGRPKKGERRATVLQLCCLITTAFCLPGGSGVPDWPDEKNASSHTGYNFPLIEGFVKSQ